jgi:FMN phosphatase YigB (HAD superfamily)
MNKIIALDIGNVCFKIDKDIWLNKLKIGAGNSALRKELNIDKNKMELGRISREEFLVSLHNLTGNRFSDNELITAYCSIIKDETAGMHCLMNDFTDSGFKIMFFSDTSPLHLDYVYSRLSFANIIFGGVFSFDVGRFKPDSRMFAEFEKRYGRPEIYIDDLEKNCIAADGYGWKAHRFTSAENCRKEVFLHI